MEKTRRPCVWPGMVAAALGAMWLALFPLWQDGSFSRITRAKWQGTLILCAVILKEKFSVKDVAASALIVGGIVVMLL